LRGHYHGLSVFEAFANEHFLNQWNILQWNLYPEIATGHHDGIGFADDVVNVFNGLGFFNFGHDACMAFLVFYEVT
jgi:hypothetical protein